MERVIELYVAQNIIYAVKNKMLKQKKRVLFSVISLLIVIILINFISATMCSINETEEVVKKALYEYFPNPEASKLNVTEIKDMLDFYLNSNNLTEVKCDIKSALSNINYDVIISRFSNLTKSITIPTCEDGTHYGKCSTTKPKYCFADQLVNRCRKCGCPSGQECQIDEKAAFTINEGRWGKCVPVTENITCKSDADCSHGFVDYLCQNNNVYGIYENYTCINTGTINSYCKNVSSEIPLLVDECDINKNEYCFWGFDKCQLACSDKTHFGNCSTTKPLYCSNGTLTDNCNSCGCSTNQSCQAGGSCITIAVNLTCSDNTPYSSCSIIKPKYCMNGTLISNCSSCGCSSGQICLSNGDCNLNNSKSDFVGEYYDNENLLGEPVLIRNDPEINFNWIPDGSPDPKINENHFSARWTKTKELISGRYKFIVRVAVEDNVRLWIDNNLILNKWGREWGDEITTYITEVNLEQGQHIIKMEYSELMGWAFAKLSWEIIEVHDAYCNDGTKHSECSTLKPKYCYYYSDTLYLVDNCFICGCSSDQVCKADGNCKSKNLTIEFDEEIKLDFERFLVNTSIDKQFSNLGVNFSCVNDSCDYYTGANCLTQVKCADKDLPIIGTSIRYSLFVPNSGTNFLVMPEKNKNLKISFDKPIFNISGYFTYTDWLRLFFYDDAGILLARIGSPDPHDCQDNFVGDTDVESCNSPNEFREYNLNKGVSTIVISQRNTIINHGFSLDDLTFRRKYILKTCSDNTPYNNCSSTKPFYCSQGTLINDCTLCGCLTNQSCQTDGTCAIVETISNLSDGSSETNITFNETTQNQTIYVEVPPEANVTNATIDVTSNLTNASLDVGSDGDIQFTTNGTNKTETTPDLSPEINEYIDNSNNQSNQTSNITGQVIFTDSGTILVPLTFYSESAGTIKISNININYVIKSSLIEEPSLLERIWNFIKQVSQFFIWIILLGAIILIVLWISRKKEIKKLKKRRRK